MKIKVLLALALVASISEAAAQTATITWTPPTSNTNGSLITGPITYNIYQGVQGQPPSPAVQKGVTGSTAVVTTNLTPGTIQCFAVSAVVGAIESAPSAAACIAIALPTPGAPTQITVVIR